MTTKLMGELKPDTLDFLWRLSAQEPKTEEEYHAFMDIQGKIFWMDDLEIPQSSVT